MVDVLDRSFGIHAQALVLRGQRAALLARNLANADTPGFKARDVDFHALLRETVTADDAPAAVALDRTRDAHLSGMPTGGWPTEAPLLYRWPQQASADGNTVETHTEHAEFTDNALRYQVSLMLMDARIRSLVGALRGE
jgi:flagellar basal-body rod protein FlgB